MLASRGGAVGKSTKDAYVCLSCRLKTQKRRYGATKARHGEAAKTNESDARGTDEHDLAAYGRQLSERFEPSVHGESKATSIQPRTRPSRDASTQEPDTTRGHKPDRRQDSRDTHATTAESLSRKRRTAAKERLEAAQLTSTTRRLIEHVRRQRPRFATGRHEPITLDRALRRWPQYSLAEGSSNASLTAMEAVERLHRIESSTADSPSVDNTLLPNHFYAESNFPDTSNPHVLAYERDAIRLGATTTALQHVALSTLMAPCVPIRRSWRGRRKAAQQTYMDMLARHLVKHLRELLPDPNPQSRVIHDLHKEMKDAVKGFPQYHLDELGDQSLPISFVRTSLVPMWQSESQMSAFENAPLDTLGGADSDMLQTLDLNVLGQDPDAFWSRSPTALIQALEQQESRWYPSEVLVWIVRKKVRIPDAAKQVNPESVKATPTKARPIQSQDIEPDVVEPSLRLKTYNSGPKQEQSGRGPRRVIKQSRPDRPLIRKHRGYVHEYEDGINEPFPTDSGVRFVPAREPGAKQTLEGTIDEHIHETPLASSLSTVKERTSPKTANPLSLWSRDAESPGVYESPGAGTSQLRSTTKTFPRGISEHYYHEATEPSQDELDSTSAGFDDSVKHAKGGVEETEQMSRGLDMETVTALGALEEAAAAAATSPTTSPSSLQKEQLPRRTTASRASAFGGFAWQGSRLVTPPLNGSQPGGVSARLYHASTSRSQQSVAATSGEQSVPQPSLFRYTTGEESYFKMPTADEAENPNGIRAQLRKWQELRGHEDPMPEVVENDDYADMETPVNNLTRLPDDSAARRQLQQEEDEKEAFTHFNDPGKEGYDGTGKDDGRFLKMGDLVEIEYLSTERESILAVYVQSVHSGAKEAQFFTMQGRWMHIPERAIMYSIPGWVRPESVKPLLEHLPTPEETKDMDTLREKAYTEDLSVPREVAAPLVKRMVDFYNESQEIYRKNASTLDEAHNILAHDTDLRYGSLISAATTLLRTSSDKLPLTALYTVRKALTHGGFAFNIDRRSHRLTGYMQIRSKEQVRMVDNVREWIRQWQDDLAQTAGMDERQLSRRRVPKGAQHVYGFLEKAKAIVVKNRESRHPMPSSLSNATNNMGISKTRHTITETSDCIKIHHGQEFTADETEIVRFMESWACSGMFMGLPRIESLPPLILQATGLYDNQRLAIGTGFVFLQELGTIMPYENRVRFDQHLLLPSSQHSKPLQNLMTSLMAMKNKHNFNDSMADLRHDWKDLPVYCIDDASAQEIDDGVSVERAGTSTDGKEQYWVHIHIANPTAFFSRDHPLAKMARHMGETIYMPERTYMMLPRWATQRHFSLAANRPALTFSAKLDEDGKTLDQKITAGTIRNVVSLTSEEVQQLISEKGVPEKKELVLTVGGDPPPSRSRRSQVPDATEKNINDLRLLEKLAAKRADIRKSNGGIFFDSHKPKVNVWQSWKGNGLAWDHPYRKGSRIVEGDPVIQMRTTGLHNWFAPSSNVVDVLVRECMLLACETAASWCSERKVPVIHRGTIPDPQHDSRKVWEEQMLPAMREDGSLPMHLGVQYIRTLGSTVLRTEPKRHAFIGMDHYSKVTSPLRRYGDMILHWQIEAALRHEAQTGQSLVTTDPNPNRSFLPFSKPVLNTIMLGLQPRESIISRAKSRAEDFWSCMLMFRKHHFQEDGELPFKTLQVFLPQTPGQLRANGSATYCVELGLNFTMSDPKKYGLEEPRQGDVWEVEIENVDVYMRGTFVRPVRLVGREGAGIV